MAQRTCEPITSMVVMETVEWEIDNACHFTHIQAAYSGGIVWKKTEQIVYTPIFGINIENDPFGPPRDVSMWESIKTIVYVKHDIAVDLWVPYKEVISKIGIRTIIADAKCNLVTYWRYLHNYTLPLREDASVTYNEDYTEITFHTHDSLGMNDNIWFSADSRIKNYRLNTFIDAMKLRGFRDMYGNCPFEGNRAYLCDNRGFDLFISTIYGSHRNRWRTNINCMFLDKSKKWISNVTIMRFDDEWENPLTHEKRRFKKLSTNIRGFKPLHYQIRVAPKTYKSLAVADIIPVTITFNNKNFATVEIPATKGNDVTSVRFDLTYSKNNTAPPASVSLFITSDNQASTNAWNSFALKMNLYPSYKLPICILTNNRPLHQIALTQLGASHVYPIDTFGWSMKQKFEFYLPTVTVAYGFYSYVMHFKTTIPTVFNDSMFGDFYGNTDYENTIPLRINVI
jgi:hypothetical protein